MKNINMKTWSRIFSAVLAAILIFMYNSNVMAVQITDSDEKSTYADGPNDTIELEKFCDDFFSKHMKKGDVPGAVISVVKDGNVMFEKGYGYASIENSIKADPNKTAFYICSTGKLFTGTAIMQLYEEGKIKDLNDNVEMYMKNLKIKNKYSKPVTFSNLLTYTSGLDDGSVIGGASRTKEGTLSYEDYMRKKLTFVAREPNFSTMYSNLGFNLLGYLVQEISGMTYKDYIKTKILEPLGMKGSTVGELPKNSGTSYLPDNKTAKQVYLPALGEGCVYSTADDMAKFMIAHLQNGIYNGNRILKEDTAKLMHEQHFTNDPTLPGVCYNFLESYKNNQRVIRHEGADAGGNVTSLYLIPEHNLGFFIEVNKADPLPIKFEDEFMNHYFPVELHEPQNTYIKKDADKFAGTYRSYDDISITTAGKTVALFMDDSDMTITSNGDGTLFMRGISFSKEPIATKLIQTGDLVFQRADNNSYIAFKKDRAGRIAYAFNDEPQKTFEKISWYDSRDFNSFLMVVCILVFIFNILRILFSLLRRNIKKTIPPLRGLELTSNIVLWANSVLNVFGIVAFSLMVMLADYEIQFGLPIIGYLSLGALLLGAISSVFIVTLCILQWLKKSSKLTTKIIYTVSTAASIAFIWFISYWNLLGFRI